jgi:hypothetical protein
VSHRHLLAASLLGLLGPVAPLHAQLRGDVDTQSLREPAVGDCTLRILTPSLLEVTRISAEAKGQPAATLKVEVNGQEAAVASTGAKRRVSYAPLSHRDLRIATWYYLGLARPLEASAGPVTVRVSGSDAAGEAMQASASFDPMRLSPAVHVNQEGYASRLPKKAMVGYYLGDMGELAIPADAGFAVVGARDGKSVFTGTLVRRPDSGYRTIPAPYAQVYEADFSAFRQPGEYRLLVPGLGTSLPFVIDDGIPMGFARTYALGLYEQRCGTSLDLPFTRFVHGECHDAPAQVPVASDGPFAFTWATIARYAAERNTDEPAQMAPAMTGPSDQLYPFVNSGPVDVTGGHHDAGDYSRYTINSAALVHYLVFTADSIPGAGALDNLGIPESGDGVGDILQEARWEADFLSKLQDTDGGFYFLVYPRDREYESNVTPDHGDPQVVWPKNTSATAAAVAALAQCASSPEFKRHYPDESARFLRQALLGWKFLMEAIARHGKGGAYQKITFYGDHFGDRDELAWAACELYLATGDTQFQDRLIEWFPNPAYPGTFRWGWWRMSESWGNAIRSYAFAARSGRLPLSALDPRYLHLCEGQVLAAGDDALDWSRQNAYATPFPPATKAVNGGGWYFSMDQASDMAAAFVIDPKPEYIDALVGAMNYEGGCNPVNVAYLTGLGVHRQREIVDQFAQNDGRVLPPSGIPLGNIQAAFQYIPAYGFDLRNASYPEDNARSSPYPFYDRWSDAYNVTTEFIAVNQARSLMVAALLANQADAVQKPWKAVRARIVVPARAVRAGDPVTLSVQVPGEDLAQARVVWEVRGMDPAFGPTYTFSPRLPGRRPVEVEAEWPDGRRAFGADSVIVAGGTSAWIRGAVPAGAAVHASGGDTWAWKTGGTSGPSGAPIHQSGPSAALHEHWFTGASEPLSIGAGDALYAWVFLDPANPPSEIMLAWNDGASWEHRAYWGADSITYGRDGSEGRHYAGPIPPAGKWVRLVVPAGAVGLEHAEVSGMGFSLVGGSADWDEAGSSH